MAVAVGSFNIGCLEFPRFRLATDRDPNQNELRTDALRHGAYRKKLSGGTVREPETRPGQPLKIVAILALLAFTTLIYYPGLSGSFIFDDTSNIVDNPAVHMESPSAETLSEAATAYGDRLPHRPLATISLAFDYWMWAGDPFGFKLTNLGLHLLITLAALILANQLFRLGGMQTGLRAPFWAALAVAALWAVHPLQVSTVLYVVQRMEMLAALFIILSLVAYIQGRVRLRSGKGGGGWLIGLSGLCTLVAISSKETGILAPFFMLALELFIFRFAASDARLSKLLKLAFGVLVILSLGIYVLWVIPEFVFGDRFVKRDFTWYERLVTQFRVLPMYIGWVLFPATDQYLFYYDQFQHSEGLLRPVTTLLGGLFLLSLAVGAWTLRNHAPLIALGIVWFLVAHALTSNLVSLELVFEHRNYFASLAVLITITAMLAKLGALQHCWTSAAALCLVLVLGLGSLTAIRSATWGDPMNLALHHVEINPLSERAGLDLAELYLGNDKWNPRGSPFVSAARKELERVAKLPKARTTADQALIILAVQREAPAPQEAWNRLIEKVKTRAMDAPDFDAIYNLVQRRYQGMNISDRRLWELHDALCQRNDIPAQIHARFGYYAALVDGDMRRATSAFRRTLDLLSEDPDGKRALRQALDDSEIQLMKSIEACESFSSEISPSGG